MQADDLSFGRSRRLLAAADYSPVFGKPDARASNAFFTILARGNQLDDARLGMAIARKKIRRAVDRNRIKRIVRESFRHTRHRLPPLDLVVLARETAATASNAELFDALEALWRKLAANSR